MNEHERHLMETGADSYALYEHGGIRYRISWVDGGHATIEWANPRSGSWATLARSTTVTTLMGALRAGGLDDTVVREMLDRLPSMWGRTETARAVAAVKAIQGILWPGGDPDHPCGADEIGDIVNALREHGFGPEV